jgi:hypothetical protein
MRRSPIILVLLALVPLHTKAAPRTDPFEQNRRLGRGINIPGVFDRNGGPFPIRLWCRSTSRRSSMLASRTCGW